MSDMDIVLLDKQIVNRMEISKKNLRVLLICSFRYALGRRTYVPDMIKKMIIDNWDVLTDHDHYQIREDIRHAIKHDMAGHDYDVKTWQELLIYNPKSKGE